MKKYVVLIFVLLNTLCYSKNFSDIEHSSYYQQLSLKEHINNTLIVNDLLIWFQRNSSQIITVTEKEKHKIIVKYFISSAEKIHAIIYLSYNYQDINEEIKFQMILNGTKKLYYNDDAKKIMLTLLSYNDEFEYYFRD